MKHFDQILLLQGGGALGAFHAGVYEGLSPGTGQPVVPLLQTMHGLQ